MYSCRGSWEPEIIPIRKVPYRPNGLLALQALLKLRKEEEEKIVV